LFVYDVHISSCNNLFEYDLHIVAVYDFPLIYIVPVCDILFEYDPSHAYRV